MSVLYPLLKPLKDLTRDDLDTVVAPTPALAAVKRARSTGHVSGLNEALAACAPGPARSVDAAWTGLEEKIHTGELAYLDNRPSAAHHRAFIQPIRGHWVVTDQVTGRARAAYTALLSSAAILRPPPRAGGGNGGGTSPTPASSPLPPTQHSEKYAVLPPPRADQRPPPGTPVEHQTTAQSAGDAQSHLVPHAADPINMVLGEESLRITDAVLPGPLPLVWARTYRSSKSDQNNGLGHGWTYPGRATLTLTASTITLHDDDGRRMDFPRPHRDRTSRHLHEGMLLRWEGLHQERLILTQPGRPIRVFERQADGERYRLSQWRHPGYVPSKYHYPRGHSAPQGVALNFHYDPAGRLQRIESTPGPGLVFRRDPHGHITAVHHQTPSGEILQPALAT
ncbi:MAG: hypothetical protein HY080_08090, partial [Gammaproteobacteria bacterium]|nr:hypothetical protein [Gammaproteobacteria bacterium]